MGMIKTDTIHITPDILTLISEIDEFKGAWRALGALAPERLKALRNIATIESIGSSTRIEGSRLSRVLTTLLLLQAGYAYVPYSSLESVIENSKEGYYLALRQTQDTIRTERPDWQPWLIFFLRTLQQQKRHLETKVEREERALIDLPELAIKILDYARDQGRVTTRDIVREHNASPNTLKVTFRSLVEKGLLIKHGAGRSTWYSRT